MSKKFAPTIAGLLALASAGCGGSSDTRPAKWSYISSVIIQPNCATANCHSQLTQQDRILLDTTAHGWLAVKPFATLNAKSPLVLLLEGTYPGKQRMPPDFPLADADIELIGRWSAAGAEWDGPGPMPVAQ